MVYFLFFHQNTIASCLYAHLGTLLWKGIKEVHVGAIGGGKAVGVRCLREGALGNLGMEWIANREL